MKKQSKTTTVYRIDLVKGKYTTISRKILMNPKLRDSSKTLLQLILNNTDEWVLILGYYQRELKWSNDKMTGAVAELIQHGYLKKEKHSKGKDKGFYYTYIISEFGNLNPNKEQVSEEEILTSLKNDNFNLNNITNDSIPSEITETKIVTESNETTTQPQVFVVDDVFWDKVIGVLDEEISGKANGEFVNKVVDYYIEQMQTGKLLLSNFDEEAVRMSKISNFTSPKACRRSNVSMFFSTSFNLAEKAFFSPVLLSVRLSQVYRNCVIKGCINRSSIV